MIRNSCSYMFNHFPGSFIRRACRDCEIPFTISILHKQRYYYALTIKNANQNNNKKYIKENDIYRYERCYGEIKKT